MKRNKKSLNTKTLFESAKNLLKLLGKNILGLFFVLPYIARKLLFPAKKPGRKIGINRRLRTILEFKKARQVIGINLAILLILASISPISSNPRDLRASEIEESQIIPEITSTITEKTFRIPVIGYISQNFSTFHQAIDYAGNNMANIYPIADGKVIGIEYGYSGYGNSILVDHGNGLISRYAHLSVVKVENGQEVDKGTSLGFVGNTGTSTGPHLHLEAIYWGRNINPLSLFE